MVLLDRQFANRVDRSLTASTATLTEATPTEATLPICSFCSSFPRARDMRITYLHQYFNTPAMTGGTRSFEMARRLVAEGHDVQMMTTDRRGDATPGEWAVTEEAGMTVHWLGCEYNNQMSVTRRLKAFVEFGWRATQRARSVPTDVVFSTSTPLTIGIPGVLAARKHDVPHVFEVRDWWPAVPAAMGALAGPGQLRAAIAMEKWIYRHSDHVVALAPGMQDGVVSRGMDRADTTVIPNSCDFDLFDVDPQLGRDFRARYDWLGDRPMVVYTGTLGRVNNIEYMVDVAIEMQRLAPDVCFVVVGSGSQEQSVRDRAEAAGVLGTNFFLLGAVPKSDIAAAVSAATFCSSFVSDIPILEDNCANKFFDALAASRPIIVNHAGWLGGLIETHQCGLQLPTADAATAAGRIAEVAHDSVWLADAGRRANQLGRTEFSRDLLAARLNGVLCNAVGVSQTIPFPAAGEFVASRAA